MSFHYRYRKQILISIFGLILIGGIGFSYFSFYYEKDSLFKRREKREDGLEKSNNHMVDNY